MRRPNGRCSLSGLVWPSPDPTSSHLQTSDRVRIRQRQLLGEALVTTAFRRQERDFLPQRVRREMGRLPFGRRGAPKDALEKPAVSGHSCARCARGTSSSARHNRCAGHVFYWFAMVIQNDLFVLVWSGRRRRPARRLYRRTPQSSRRMTRSPAIPLLLSANRGQALSDYPPAAT